MLKIFRTRIRYAKDFRPFSTELSEDEIERIQSKSRLKPHHERKLRGEVPHLEPIAWFHHTVAYKKKQYGKYGESSGVNPGIMWPTKENLQKKLEYEALVYPTSFHETVQNIQDMREAKKNFETKRMADVEAKMEIIEKMKRVVEEKKEAKERELKEAKLKRERLIEEVKKHFGYKIDPTDDKFQELLLKKEKEQRKVKKDEKKALKESQALAALTEYKAVTADDAPDPERELHIKRKRKKEQKSDEEDDEEDKK